MKIKPRKYQNPSGSIQLLNNGEIDKIIERTHPDGTITYHYNDNGTEHPLTDLGNDRYSLDKGNGVTSFFDVNKAKQYRQWQKEGGPAADIDKVMLTTLALGTAPVNPLFMNMVTNPVTTAGGMIGGHIGGKAVDATSKYFTGRSWADNVTKYTGAPKWFSEMSNPGMWFGGMVPFMTRGSRSLLSAGDQIVRDMTKDVMHYGPITVARNPRGWVRPYVDQVKNGYYGWRDSRIVLPDHSKETFKGFRAGKPIEEIERFEINGIPVSEYTTSNPQYHEIYARNGQNLYYRTNSEGAPLWGVTQHKGEPNIFSFHIGGNRYFKLGRKDKLDIHKALESLPKGSYVADLPEKGLVSGQTGINFANKNGRTPTLGEMIKASKMKPEIREPQLTGYADVYETPLSSSSMGELLSRGTNPKRPWELRYSNGYMTHFNSQGLHPQLHPDQFLFIPKQERLKLATDFVSKYPGTRKPFIGLDGKLKISIPINKKTN